MPGPLRAGALLAPLSLTTSLLLGTPAHSPTVPGRAPSAHSTSGVHSARPAPRGRPRAAAPAGFPARFTAPYLETWASPDVLARTRQATGLRYFTLAFVVSDGGCDGAFDGTIPVDDADWLAAVRELRAAGGDVIVSFGGSGGRELALACDTADSLKAAYRRVVDTLGLTRIDLDIEGATLDDQPADDRRNQALAELQRDYAAAGRSLAVDYTLPVNPWGLSPNALDLLTDARRHRLDVDLVNIMTMDYGERLDMGDAAVAAANGLHAQLAALWPERTAAQLWAMQGNTPMIGVNDDADETFSQDDATQLAAFAAGNGLRMLSFWSLGRDRPCPAGGAPRDTCSETAQNPYDYSRIIGGTPAHP
ncbi:hypothetical protein GCM10009760_47360 [Kitasatospora kazusensis]|uniref:GH18 domain-containing protein n=1 Tax=Kitasatospora kazusensis TaxID=407974 RepID=A0ABP5LQI8_9ACTN